MSRRVVKRARGQSRISQQKSGSGRVGNKSDRIQGTGAHGKQHQGTDCRPGHCLNTPPAISLR
ncbi:unnamed protein product [Staurois parvus]|uniref:Uncharacterized protein n=1 Tax=Staurois parvus TaxID=386267 RepID=A0ABN9EMW2_9NEOB|nr:unnamed protein product [Staurois parvus]